jgi:hypothetical protein
VLIAVGGTLVRVAVGGTVVLVSVGGTLVRVAVGGRAVLVAVGGTLVRVAVGGRAVLVAVGGTLVRVAVGGRAVLVAVGGTLVRVAVAVKVRVAVGGTAVLVAVGGTFVRVAVAVKVRVAVAVEVRVEVAVATAAGLSAAFPGKDRPLISCKLVKPSPSESRFSIAANPAAVRPFTIYADPYAFIAGAEVWHNVQESMRDPTMPGYLARARAMSPGAADTWFTWRSAARPTAITKLPITSNTCNFILLLYL